MSNTEVRPPCTGMVVLIQGAVQGDSHGGRGAARKAGTYCPWPVLAAAHLYPGCLCRAAPGCAVGWLGSCTAGGGTGLVWRSPRTAAGDCVLQRAGPCTARALPGMAALSPAAARDMGGRAMRGARAMGSLLTNNFFLSLI